MKVDLNPENYDPEKWKAIERLRQFQLSEEAGIMRIETLEVDKEGRILFDRENPLYREWFD